MKKFLQTCVHVRRQYPLLWDHSSKANRWIMVYYHLPCLQFTLFPGFKKN